MKTNWLKRQAHAVIEACTRSIKNRAKRSSVPLAVMALIAMPAPLPMHPPELTPGTISMGSFYDGASVHLEGEAPLASGVIVVLRGVEKDEFFNRKGRFGVIWLNADRIHFQHAPSLFYTFSSGDAESMLSRAELNKYVLDEAAVLHGIGCLCHCKCNLTEVGQQSGSKDAVPDPAYREVLVKEFLQSREQDGDYRTVPRSVNLEKSGSSLHYKLDFRLPVNLAAGSYKIQVVACDHQQVIGYSEETLVATKAGVAEYIQGAAFRSPWMYGAAAVLIALLAGFAMDLLSNKVLRRRKASGSIKKQSPEVPAEVPENGQAKESDVVHHH